MPEFTITESRVTFRLRVVDNDDLIDSHRCQHIDYVAMCC